MDIAPHKKTRGDDTFTKKPNILEEIAYRDTWGQEDQGAMQNTECKMQSAK